MRPVTVQELPHIRVNKDWQRLLSPIDWTSDVSAAQRLASRPAAAGMDGRELGWEHLCAAMDHNFTLLRSSHFPTKQLDPKDMAKLKDDIEQVLTLFKGFVAENRPQLDIATVAPAG